MNGGAAPAHLSLGCWADRAAWEASGCDHRTLKPYSRVKIFNPLGAGVAAFTGAEKHPTGRGSHSVAACVEAR